MIGLLETLLPFLKGLPPWSEPIWLAFIPSFAVLAVLLCWRANVMHRKGIVPTRSKTNWKTLIIAMPVFYIARSYAPLADFLNWPDRQFPYYHAHALPMIVGFGAACYASLFVMKIYAALFLRAGHREFSGDPVHMYPGWQAGDIDVWGWRKIGKGRGIWRDQ